MTRFRCPHALVACGFLVLAASCGDDLGPQTIPDHCDPLVPDVCALPFPSNRWLAVDPTMPSGRRVVFDPAMMPVSRQGISSSPEVFRLSDGFSPGTELVTFFPDMSIEGLADANHIEESLAEDSRTIIIDAETGARIPHWAELNMRADDPEQRSLLIRSAVRLEDTHTYIVAIRGLVDSQGRTITASPAFAALRDGKRFPHPSIRQRRARYEEIFAALGQAGVARSELQLAWDFSISSQDNQSARMLHVRDTGLALLGEAAPSFEIDDIVDNPRSGVARRIDGRVTVPLFLDGTGVSARAVLDDAGMPTQNGSASFPFVAFISESALLQDTDPVIQFGHGIFGQADDVMRGEMVAIANAMGAVCISVDWLGLTIRDPGHIAGVVGSGRLENFVSVPDRGQQAMLNAMYALRLLVRGLPTHASTRIDDEQVFSPGPIYYVGNSLGGIYGATYVALSPDIERAVLFVPGQPFSLLLPRSDAFNAFNVLFNLSYPDQREHPYMIALMQMLWDRVEPTGFSNHILENPFPGSSSPDVLVVDAIGDPAVSTRAAHVLARTLALPNLAPANREVFGLDAVEGPIERAALLEVSFGLEPEPVENVSWMPPFNPHDYPFGNATIQAIARQFLETGTIENLCDGVCDPD